MAHIRRRVRPCRHCRKRPGWKSRGLCATCYPRHRDAYPMLRDNLGRRAGPTVADGRRPAEPCPHLVGSAGRLATLAQRAERGESLHHPLDNPARDCPRGPWADAGPARGPRVVRVSLGG